MFLRSGIDAVPQVMRRSSVLLPEASHMNTLPHRALSISAAALLAGWGASQPPFGEPMPQSLRARTVGRESEERI